MGTGLDFMREQLGDRDVVDISRTTIGPLRITAVLASGSGMPGPEVMEQWAEAKQILLDAEFEAEEEAALAAYQALPRRKRRLVDQLIQELTDRSG